MQHGDGKKERKQERRDARNDLGPAVFAQEASTAERETRVNVCVCACEVPSVSERWLTINR